ncbi:unnamed protein product [Durusdinium trenchii]|uniref:Uncharacterized protein n=1 Tax=Durusdinium trenchii TaxID=1381693 RepID=A0ABP0SUT3_9DINO
MPGICSSKDLPVCLMGTAGEPRCSELLQLSPHQGTAGQGVLIHGRLLGFLRVYAHVLRQGSATSFGRWDYRDHKSSTAHLLISASQRLARQEAQAQRAARLERRGRSSEREQLEQLRFQATLRIRDIQACALVKSWNQHLSTAALPHLSRWELQRLRNLSRATRTKQLGSGWQKLEHFCVRDRSTATDFHSPYIPASILTGRRLELIFVEEQEESESRQRLRDFWDVSHRFIARGVRLSEFLEILENAEEHWPGLTRFVHDGHSQSQRCPDCANIGHFLVDDMLIDLVAFLQTRNLPVERTVANLQSNLGAYDVKRFEEDFIRSIFESPTTFMAVDETHCFEAAIVSAHPFQRQESYEALLVQGAAGARYSPEGTFRQVRAHWHLAAQVGERWSTRERWSPILLDARPKASRRTWANAKELGALLGAEVFDFTGLRWTERVHALAAAQVYIGGYGGQVFQLLAMQENSLAIVLACKVLKVHWHATFFFRLLKLSGLQLHWMEPEGCLPLPSHLQLNASARSRFAALRLPREAHPVQRLGVASQTVVQHQGVLCAFRAPVKTPLSEADWMAEVAVSPLALEVLSSGFEQALRRCVEWYNDCEVLVPAGPTVHTWALFTTVRHSDYLKVPRDELALKIGCVLKKDEEGGTPRYELEDTSTEKVYDHLMINVSTSPSTMEEIRQLVLEHQKSPARKPPPTMAMDRLAVEQRLASSFAPGPYLSFHDYGRAEEDGASEP